MRSLMLLPALAACLLFPSSSFAGGYAVTACFGYENAAWSEWEPSPFATAYTACPGGALDLRRPQSNEGMMRRRVRLRRCGSTLPSAPRSRGWTSMSG